VVLGQDVVRLQWGLNFTQHGLLRKAQRAQREGHGVRRPVYSGVVPLKPINLKDSILGTDVGNMEEALCKVPINKNLQDRVMRDRS
jgi:hypothetical protein